MDQKQVLQAALQVIGNHEREVKAQAGKMVSVLKVNCRTYAEIDATLKQIRRDLTWDGKLQCLPLLDAVEAAIEKEKGCLLVAGSQSSTLAQ